jgi:hypothetical protein
MISAVPHPSAVARIIRARQTCFCRLLRPVTTAAKRSRSARLTSILIPSRIAPYRTRRANMESYDCVIPLEAGHTLIGFADGRLREAYHRALINVSFSAAAWAKFEPKIQEVESELPSMQDQARRLTAYIKNRLYSRFDAGVMDGQAFKTAESEQSESARRLGERSNEPELGEALGEVVSMMLASLFEQNPAQAEALRRAIEARRMFGVITLAACGVIARGRFTPKDILCAALHRDREGYRLGKAPMQDWVRSGNWGDAVLRAGPYNDDARLHDLATELVGRLTAWDAER